MVILDMTKGLNHIGRLGENEHRTFRFPDSCEVLAMYPEATVSVLVKRPGDSVAYPVAPGFVEIRNGAAYWTVQSADLARIGRGNVELTFVDGTTVAKNIIYDVYVDKALDGAGDPPEPWESWQTDITAIAGEIAGDRAAAEQAAEDAIEAQGKAEAAQEAAESAEQGAGESAGAADTSARAAAESAGAADRSAGAADQSAQAAGRSATAADQSAQAAAGSVTAAGEQAGAADASARAAAASALEAERMTFGTEGGVPVPATSPYNENNAKHYAEESADSATAAGNAQTAAEDARDAAQAAAGDFQGLTASVTGLAAGASPTVEATHSSGGLYNLAFGIPKGDKGDKGDTGNPAPAEQVIPAVNAYLAENFSNPSNPPLDRTLLSSSSAAPADMVGDLESAINLKADQAEINKIEGGTYQIEFNPTVENWYINKDTGTISESNNARLAYIECLPNTKYIVHKTAGTRYVVGYTSVAPAVNVVCDGYVVDYTASDITIETEDDTTYLCIYYWFETTDTISAAAMLASVTVSEDYGVSLDSTKAAVSTLNSRMTSIEAEIDEIEGGTYQIEFDPTVQNWYIDSSGVISYDVGARMAYIECLPNTKYTVHKTAGTRYAVGYTSVTPALNVECDSYIRDNTASDITIETNGTAAYLCIYYWFSTDSISAADMLASVTVLVYGLTLIETKEAIGILNQRITDEKADLENEINAINSGFIGHDSGEDRDYTFSTRKNNLEELIAVLQYKEVHSQGFNLSLDSIAWENLTYRDIFMTHNFLNGRGFDFENGMPIGTQINLGTPTISDTYSAEGSKSLKIDTSGDRANIVTQVSNPVVVRYKANKPNYMFASIRVDRYSAGKIGFLMDAYGGPYVSAEGTTNGFETFGTLFQRVTDGWDDYQRFCGSWEAESSVEGYIDAVVIVDGSIFATSPTKEEFTELYENYLSILNDGLREKTEELVLMTDAPKVDPTDTECKNAFLSAMNSKATELGMSGTYYASASGLTENSYSTPQDMLKLGLAVCGTPNALRTWSTPNRSFSIGGHARTISVTNNVISGSSTDLGAYYKLLGGKGGTLSNGIRAQILLVEIEDTPCLLSLMVDNATSSANIFKSAKELADMLKAQLDGQTPTEGTNLSALVTNGGGYAGCVVPNTPSAYDRIYNAAGIISRTGTISNSPTAQNVPASTSKTMTMLVALENADDLHEIITLKSADLEGGSGSTYYAGDTLVLADALCIMMMESSNTLAQAIGRIIGGKILQRSGV